MNNKIPNIFKNKIDAKNSRNHYFHLVLIYELPLIYKDYIKFT